MSSSYSSHIIFSFHLIFYPADLILSGNSILFLRNNSLPSSLNQISYRNTFYLIWRILSLLLVFDLVDIIIRFKGGHMPDTCLLHVVHMYYCTLLCNAVCTALSIVLFISFYFTYLAFYLTCIASLFYLPIIYFTY